MKTLFGGILLAAGILIAGVSGLCSLVILGMGVAQSVPSPQARGPGASLRD